MTCIVLVKMMTWIIYHLWLARNDARETQSIADPRTSVSRLVAMVFLLDMCIWCEFYKEGREIFCLGSSKYLELTWMFACVLYLLWLLKWKYVLNE
jgi:hypothetical protein